MSWVDDAACRPYRTAYWFPARGEYKSAATTFALKVCATCRVRGECLDEALAIETIETRHGIRGGYSVHQRARLAGGPPSDQPVTITSKEKTMTTTTATTPELAARRAELWQRRPDLTETEVADLVDAQLEAEAAETAAGRAHAADLGAGLAALAMCPCGAGESFGRPSGLCPACERVSAVMRAELEAAEVLADGRTRGELIAAQIETGG